MAIAINGNGTITGITAGGLPDASIIDADIAAVASSKLTGALPAISGASLTNLPAGGDSRNFVIDGDFTQWPEGTSARTIANLTYISALLKGSMVRSTPSC